MRQKSEHFDDFSGTLKLIFFKKKSNRYLKKHLTSD